MVEFGPETAFSSVYENRTHGGRKMLLGHLINFKCLNVHLEPSESKPGGSSVSRTFQLGRNDHHTKNAIFRILVDFGPKWA